MSRRSASALCIALLCSWIACASVPDAPAPGRSAVVGFLKLVPREGVTPSSGGGSYGDRRLRDVRLVDYSSPGFSVVYVEAEAPPSADQRLEIRSTRLGTVVEPETAAVGAAGTLHVVNESDAAHLVSYPAGGRVERLEPGASLDIPVARAGEQGLFLLDAPKASVLIFAAPGPFAVTNASGRYHLDDLSPGTARLRAWHPRFPPLARELRLDADVVHEIDLEIGVGVSEKAAHEH